MTSRVHLIVPRAAVSSLLLLSACAQGIQLSSTQVISAAGMIGDAVDRSTRSRGVRIPRSPAPTAAAARTLQTADRFVGTTYVWGGNTPDGGFDCSGFTKYVFAQQGIQLPRTAREQARVGESVALDYSAFRPGDLLFFAEPKEAISHVAIYIGDGRIIHASSAMGQVGYLDLDGDRAAWYVQNMVAVRRLR
jgi:cell wall-associated NlpC family hydrolase